MFEIQPSEAWRMSPQEYWMLYRFKFKDAIQSRPMTRDEFEELKKRFPDV